MAGFFGTSFFGGGGSSSTEEKKEEEEEQTLVQQYGGALLASAFNYFEGDVITKAREYGDDVIATVKYYSEEALSYIGSLWHPYKMLVIGEVGSGKTSFVNLLCNSKLIEELGKGVDAAKLEQIMRYNDLMIEDLTLRAMASKTREAKSYEAEIYRMRMTVIDTPGFGDSRGLEQDKENVKQIIDALKYQDYINCVCLVINGRQSRMSASLKYILSEITAIMPKEVFDNIIIVFTNTADSLDCDFNVRELDDYFGKKLEHIFYIENPYCKIEKAKQKATQLSPSQITRSFGKSFEDTTKSLHSIQKTIKDFPDVHTLTFTRLYNQKQEKERDVIIILISYDQQTELEKRIKAAENEVDAALKSKRLSTDFKTKREVDVYRAVPTPDKRHNTLCGASGCYSNCHIPCYLPKSYEEEKFKQCRAMGGTDKCQVCGHSYRHHYHNEVVFEKVTEREDFLDEEVKEKFKVETDMKQRADLLRKGLQTRREELLRKKDGLLVELNNKISEFQELGISNQNYAKVLEKQWDAVKHRIEATVGDQREQLNALSEDLQKRLKAALEQ